MKRVRSKGFTLVEILAAVAILGILVVIVLGLINTYSRKGKDDYNDKLLDQAIVSAKAFYTESKDRVPLVDNYDMVSLKELKTGNYLSKDFIDSKNDSCMDESFVLAENDGKIGYYACLKCGDQKYMTDESKCDYDYDKPKNEPKDDEEGANDISCKITKKKVSSGIKVTVEATGAKKLLYTVGSSENEMKGNTFTIEKSGYYTFYASDGNAKSRCGSVDYDSKDNDADKNDTDVNNTDIEYIMYYATASQYKNKQTTGLEEYDGTEWKKGYAYVKITNSSKFSKISPSLDSNGGFWITKEGKVTTKVTATDKNSKTSSVNLITRLDRTKPGLSIKGATSDKKVEVASLPYDYVNKGITVTVTANDTYSNIESAVTSVGGSKYSHTSEDFAGKKATITKFWKKPSADRKFVMVTEVCDEAGNCAKIKGYIGQDVEPPYRLSGLDGRCYSGKDKTKDGYDAWIWKHTWVDDTSGIKEIKSKHCYNSGQPVNNEERCSYMALEDRGWSDRRNVRKTYGGVKSSFRMEYRYSPSSGKKYVWYIFKACDRAGNCLKRLPESGHDSDNYIPEKSSYCK